MNGPKVVSASAHGLLSLAMPSNGRSARREAPGMSYWPPEWGTRQVQGNSGYVSRNLARWETLEKSFCGLICHWPARFTALLRSKVPQESCVRCLRYLGRSLPFCRSSVGVTARRLAVQEVKELCIYLFITIMYLKISHSTIREAFKPG